MKKLGKLTISANKVIKNEELVNLRGGYDDGGGAGSCAAVCEMPDGGYKCNVSKYTAQQYANSCAQAGGIGRWCCDSCSGTSWYETWCVQGPGY